MILPLKLLLPINLKLCAHIRIKRSVLCDCTVLTIKLQTYSFLGQILKTEW